jgi:hypothetical protein
LLVPQSVNLEGIEINRSFVETHVILPDPKCPSHFVTLTGLRGIFKEGVLPTAPDYGESAEGRTPPRRKREILYVVEEPPDGFDPLSTDIHVLFDE